MNTKDYDLIIIGGGAAGMMAAISSKRAHPRYSVAIVDRTFALGRKILVCGAGRCNITNKNLERDVEKRYYGAGKHFIKSVFNQFGYKDIVAFFNELGIELYVERKTDIGKLFPTTNQAKTVADLLYDELQRLGVEIYLNTEVSEVERQQANFVIRSRRLSTTDKSAADSEMHFIAKQLVLSAGGKTYPALGSNGSGYDLAHALGHEIVTPVPSALPLESKNRLSQLLQGVRVDAEVTSIIDGAAVKTRSDELMFTQYGFSGPVILNISREISIHFNREHKQNAAVRINFLPGYDRPAAEQMLRARWQRRPEQSVAMSLLGLFPAKLPAVLLELAAIDPEKPSAQLSEAEITELVKILTAYKATISGTRGWNEAEFTAGGVDTKGVNPQTLQSKICPGLYFCGEILNVDGDVGGFNLSWSWASGFVAGKLAGI